MAATVIDKRGYLQICELTNMAEAGLMPVEQLTIIDTAYYEKQTAGYNRMYAAMGAAQRIDLLVKCYNTDPPTGAAEYYVRFPDFGADQYRIALMQEIVEERALLLTLERINENYDVADSET